MGMEVTEACRDKEPDSVLIHSSGASPVLNDATAPIHSDVMAALEHPLPEKSDVKKCISENAGKVTETCQAGKGEGQGCPRLKVDNGLQEKIKALSMKKDGETRGKFSPKSASKTSSPSGRINCTVPRPFSLETEKRASIIRPLETVVSKSPRKSMTNQPPNCGKKYQQNLMRKPLQSENKKQSDEEESSSVASDVSPTVRASRSKTVASAPIFSTMERAEKRREFYSKLEEKQQALEAEKLQSEARTKEEIETAIKQLRRSMMFKASPLPSFYHEQPNTKHEPKKALPTRAKSPKLGRRKSCSDAVSLLKKRTSKANRHSIAAPKEDPNSSDTSSGSSSNALSGSGSTYEHNEEPERERGPINGTFLSAVNRENKEISVMP